LAATCCKGFTILYIPLSMTHDYEVTFHSLGLTSRLVYIPLKYQCSEECCLTNERISNILSLKNDPIIIYRVDDDINYCNCWENKFDKDEAVIIRDMRPTLSFSANKSAKDNDKNKKILRIYDETTWRTVFIKINSQYLYMLMPNPIWHIHDNNTFDVNLVKCYQRVLIIGNKESDVKLFRDIPNSKIIYQIGLNRAIGIMNDFDAVFISASEKWCWESIRDIIHYVDEKRQEYNLHIICPSEHISYWKIISAWCYKPWLEFIRNRGMFIHKDYSADSNKNNSIEFLDGYVDHADICVLLVKNYIFRNILMYQ